MPNAKVPTIVDGDVTVFELQCNPALPRPGLLAPQDDAG